MKILHYSLGLPPFRSGGLTKYSQDLMHCQIKQGDDVALLYPGDSLLLSNTPSIKQNQTREGIQCFELVNPSPIPLFYGVKSPLHIVQHPVISVSKLDFLYLLFKPDIFHIHTLMALPIELVAYLKSKGVKVVFSSHDYYGLCAKVNFINNKQEICNDANPTNCMQCNADASSSLFLKLRNLSYVMRFKNTINYITKNNRSEASDKSLETTINTEYSESKVDEYNELLKHYCKLFSLVDHFHFNSKLTASVYNKYLKIGGSSIVSVSHCDIHDKRLINEPNINKLKFGFIGNLSLYKGFPLLREALIELYREGFGNWELLVWGSVYDNVDADCEKIIYKGKYKNDEMRMVYNSFNLLVLPSIWKETFSFITLESLSFGVPVLVSENVGAKDIVAEYDDNFIIQPNKEELKTFLKTLLIDPKESLKKYHKNLKHHDFNFLMINHVKDIEKMYNSILK